MYTNMDITYNNSCVHSVHNKDICNVLGIHFTDRLTDFRVTLYSGAKRSNSIQNSYFNKQTGRLYTVQQAAMYHTYRERQYELLIQTISVDQVCWLHCWM
jgi:hypothetical protein